MSSSPQLARVRDHLSQYDHPLLAFSARETNGQIEILIDLKRDDLKNDDLKKDDLRNDVKSPTAPIHTYVFPIHPRDLESPQFAWQLQRQLYDALHDYFIEMFIRTPQDRKQPDAKNSLNY